MMNLKEFLRKALHMQMAKTQETAATENRKPVTSQTHEKAPTQHDYFNSVAVTCAMSSKDYGWDPKPFKRVILTNVSDCKDKISVVGVANSWRGTGHYEWELLLALNFVNKVVEALKNASNEANISEIFGADLHASDGRVFSQKQIYEHIILFFDVLSETAEELRLAVHV